jgi:hypothetical protein
MPFLTSKVGGPTALAIASAFAAIVGASSIAPAFAGDDGAAPIWQGLGGLVGLSGLAGKEKDPPIDYRERARLVLPPKMVLPPPGSSPAQRAAAWPLDPDVEKARKEKDALHAILESQSDLEAMRDGNRLSPDQLRVDRSKPGQSHSADRCSGQTHRTGCNNAPFHNVLETIGLANPDEVKAGEEPDRDWLTDPPKGYRIPTTNTVATFDAKKKESNDPRAALYHPPE